MGGVSENGKNRTLRQWFYAPTVSLETQANIQALLLLRRNLPLRRDCLLLFLFWLHLRHMGAAVRYIVPQRGSQLLAVVGEDLRVVCAARDGNVGHAVIEQVFGPQFGIDVDQHPVGGLALVAIVVFLSLFETDPQVRRVFCPPKELYEGRPCAADPRGRVLPPFEELIETGKVVGLNFPVVLNPALAKTIGTMMKIDDQRAVQLRIPKMDAEPDKHFRPTVFICDEYQNFATVGGDNPTGDERFLSISRQPKCIPIVASQSISSLTEALPNEGVKTLLQAFRTKVFLTTSDPETARYASELCGKADRTRISYTVSESSTNANVGWLSGRTSSSKGSVSASKQYQKHKEPLFEEKTFFDLKNAQAVVVAFDGVSPLPPTFCYLKPDFLPVTMTWFEQERIGFDPGRIEP